MDTLAVFGLMLFVFLHGVKTDPTIFLKSGKRPLAIGILGFFVPYALAGLVALVLNHFLSLDHDISNVLHLVAVLQSLTSFPVIACFLAELKLLNSELGRLASCSSIVSDMCHWFIVAVRIATRLTIARSLRFSLSTILLVIFFVVGIRPAALWAIRHTPEGKPVKEIYISVVLIALLFCGFMGEVIGINAFISSFVLGLFIPDGPPLGAALVERFDCFVSVLLMPIFFTSCGLKVDIFAIKNFKNVGMIQLVVVAALFGKMIGTMLPPILCRMRLRDALSLGIIMNSKGIAELAILIRWKEHNVSHRFSYLLMDLRCIDDKESIVVH